jgi:hypothetical protein
MASNIQFIVSTGSTSNEAKKAQRKIVRSHVTAQRYQRKRKEEVQAYRLKNPEPVDSNPEIPPEIEIVAIHDASSKSTTALQTDTDTDPESLAITMKSPAIHLQQYLEDATFSRMYELGPEEHAGLWLPFPYSFPTLGSPYDDPFVSIPAGLSPRISKHLFYCT